jgi:hypothetical protein
LMKSPQNVHCGLANFGKMWHSHWMPPLRCQWNSYILTLSDYSVHRRPRFWKQGTLARHKIGERPMFWWSFWSVARETPPPLRGNFGWKRQKSITCSLLGASLPCPSVMRKPTAAAVCNGASGPQLGHMHLWIWRLG